MEDGYYEEEIVESGWRTSFNKQSIPDPQARTKKVLPHARLVQKKGRFFTTDTSSSQRSAELADQTLKKQQLKTPKKFKSDSSAATKKQAFSPKNQ